MLATLTINDPSRPIVSNDDAQPYATADGWPARLVRHPTVTVEWRASMLTLVEQLGAQALLEVGHGTMIAGVAKRTVPGTPVIGIAAPHDVELLATPNGSSAPSNEGNTKS
jgi:[acyl-carrier-protein] S-malonyltransferase